LEQEKMDLSISGSTLRQSLVQAKLTTGRGRMFWITGALLLSAILAGWKLSAVPLDDHESYVSVTAREMLGGAR